MSGQQCVLTTGGSYSLTSNELWMRSMLVWVVAHDLLELLRPTPASALVCKLGKDGVRHKFDDTRGEGKLDHTLRAGEIRPELFARDGVAGSFADGRKQSGNAFLVFGIYVLDVQNVCRVVRGEQKGQVCHTKAKSTASLEHLGKAHPRDTHFESPGAVFSSPQVEVASYHRLAFVCGVVRRDPHALAATFPVHRKHRVPFTGGMPARCHQTASLPSFFFFFYHPKVSKRFTRVLTILTKDN